MANFHEKLYQFAEYDLKAANILRDNNMFAHAIYHYVQCFEKCTKSILAYYYLLYEKLETHHIEKKLKNTHGHKLTGLTIEMMKILTDDDKRLYIRRGGKETDDFVQTSYRSIESLRQHKYEEDELIVNFRDVIEHNYKAYLKIKDNEVHLDDGYGWKFLREQFLDPSTKHLKYNTISWIITPVIERMDEYVRYPRKSVLYNNIEFLKDYRNRRSCHLLDEMISDIIDLVPLVWHKIEKLDTRD